ncbi:Gibberellin 3-beta-dioxygenase 1 [Linum perenne]
MTTLKDAFSQFTIQNDPIVPLDFDAVEAMPETHIWHDHDSTIDIDREFPIPVIDLSDPRAGHLMVEACEKWGLFNVTNHGIPLEMLADVEAMIRRLFDLPTSQKLKALKCRGGVSGYGQTPFARFFEKGMWSEGFTVVGSPADHASRLWPDDYRVFCSDVMDDYQICMKELATKLLRQILQTLNISDEELRRISSPEFTNTTLQLNSLQLNSYPPCPDPTRAIGLAPHTDTSFLTILHTASSVKALQIFSGGSWGMVAPVTGAVTVNVGDLLQVITNGRFQSVRHRVVMTDEHERRVSVASFFYPSTEFVLSPLGSDDGGRRYRSVSVKEFIELKYQNLGDGFSSIRKDSI